MRVIGPMRITGLVALLLLGCGALHARDRILFKFDSRISEHENQWVVFPPTGQADAVAFGLFYIDPAAGCTVHYGGTFHVGPNGRLKLDQEAQTDLPMAARSHLDRDVMVAPLTAAQLAELGLAETPDWLTQIKDKSSPVVHGINWGRAYNQLGACAKALQYLEPVYAVAPYDEKLLVELSHAYKFMNRPADAQLVLAKALPRQPKSFVLRREYAGTFFAMKQWRKAATEFQQALALCPSDALEDKAKIALYISYALQQVGARNEAAEWTAKAETWAPDLMKTRPVGQ